MPNESLNRSSHPFDIARRTRSTRVVNTFTVEDQAEMLALGADPGDQARRLDVLNAAGHPTLMRLDALPASDPANWVVAGGAAQPQVSIAGVDAGPDQGSVEATFNAQNISVPAGQLTLYTYNGQTYFYTGNHPSPVTAATAGDFRAAGAPAQAPPDTITFSAPHGLPNPLTAVTPGYVDAAGAFQPGAAAPDQSPEFYALATVDATTVQVVAGDEYVELPADIAPVPARGVTQYVSTTPGQLTATKPTPEILAFTVLEGRKARFWSWRPLDTTVTPAAPDAWVDSTASIQTSAGDRIRVLPGHVPVLPATPTTRVQVQFMPGNSPPDWTTLAGSFDGGAWDVGQGQADVLAGARVATLVANPGAANWEILV